MNHIIKKSIIILVSILIVAVGFYALLAGFDESRWFKRNSIDYFLLMHSEYVKDFPLPKYPIDVSYNTSCGDGSKQPYTAIHLEVKSIDQSYMQEIDRFITSKKLIQINAEGIYRGSKVYKNQNGDDVELVIIQDGSKCSIIFEHRVQL